MRVLVTSRRNGPQPRLFLSVDSCHHASLSTQIERTPESLNNRILAMYRPGSSGTRTDKSIHSGPMSSSGNSSPLGSVS